MTPGQTDLLTNLGALRSAIASTRTLKTILDDSWFEAVEQAIRRSPSLPSVPADPSGFLYDFCHLLRGADWFEEAQQLALDGRLDEVGEDAKLALLFAGIDPLRTVLPLLESRLQAFEAFSVKPDKVRIKLAELQAARSSSSFKNHLFELSVLGDLALKGVLIDIEDAATSVDGVIKLDDRDVLVEATNTVQQVIPDFVGVFSTDPNVEILQVIKKLRKKVAEGRQLARANGKPTLLFLARTRLGAGHESSQIAVEECLGGSDFSALSGVVLADSWKLYRTWWHPSIKKPDVPLTDLERETLTSFYGGKNRPAV